MTENDLLCTAFFAHSTDLLQRTAQVLGNTADAERYGSLLADIKAAFCHEFVSPAGRLSGNSQTAYVLALHFDLLPEAERAAAGVLSLPMHPYLRDAEQRQVAEALRGALRA